MYAQQNAFFHTIKRDICPRKAFLVDLVEQLKEFLEAGDQKRKTRNLYTVIYLRQKQ
jgi:hypothetical protein